jgi:hypothetical protein
MIMSKFLSVFIASVLLAAFSLGGTRVMAGEILITKNGIHLGWVTSKDKFTTCRNTVMEIGEGSVEETKDSCPTFERVPSVKGSVDSIDDPNQILWVKDERGQIQKLFFFESTEWHGRTQLKDLEKGDRVIVTIPIPGRAGLIQTERKQDSKRLF